jgi:hypothetical protein
MGMGSFVIDFVCDTCEAVKHGRRVLDAGTCGGGDRFSLGSQGGKHSVELDETSCSTLLGGALLLDPEMSTWLVSSKASGV